MVVLHRDECLKLKAHFGDAYLSKALYDIASKRDQSVVFSLIEVKPSVSRKEKKKKKKKKATTGYVQPTPPPPPPSSESREDGYIQRFWKSLVDTLYGSFKRLVTFLTTKLSWRVIVEAGSIPVEFDEIYKSVSSLASLTGKAFVRGFAAIGQTLSRVWSYVREIFAADAENLDAEDVDTLDEMEKETSQFHEYVFRLGNYVVSYFENIARKTVRGFLDLVETVRMVLHETVGIAMNGLVALCESCVETNERVTRFMLGIFCKHIDLRETKEIESFFDYFKRAVGGLVGAFSGTERVENTDMYKSGMSVGLAGLANPAQWLVRMLNWLVDLMNAFSQSISSWVLSFVPAMTGMFVTLCSDKLRQTFHRDPLEPTFEMGKNVELLKQLSTDSHLSSETRESIKSTLRCVDVVDSHEHTSGGGASLEDRVELMMQCLYGSGGDVERLIQTPLAKRVLEGQLGTADLVSMVYVKNAIEHLIATELVVAISEVKEATFAPIGVKGETVTELEKEREALIKKRDQRIATAETQKQDVVIRTKQDKESMLEQRRRAIEDAFYKRKLKDQEEAYNRGKVFDEGAWDKEHDIEFWTEIHAAEKDLIAWEARVAEEKNDAYDEPAKETQAEIDALDAKLGRRVVKLHVVTSILFSIALGALSYYYWDTLSGIFNDLVFGVIPNPASPEAAAAISNATLLNAEAVKEITTTADDLHVVRTVSLQAVGQMLWRGAGKVAQAAKDGASAASTAAKGVVAGATATKDMAMWAAKSTWSWVSAYHTASIDVSESNVKNVKYVLENAASGNVDHVMLVSTSVLMRLALHAAPAAFFMHFLYGTLFTAVAFSAGEHWKYATSHFVSLFKSGVWLTAKTLYAIKLYLTTRATIAGERMQRTTAVAAAIAPAAGAMLKIPQLGMLAQTGLNAYGSGVQGYQQAMAQQLEQVFSLNPPPLAPPPPPPLPATIVQRRRELKQIGPAVRENIVRVVEREEKEAPAAPKKKKKKKTSKQPAAPAPVQNRGLVNHDGELTEDDVARFNKFLANVRSKKRV